MKKSIDLEKKAMLDCAQFMAAAVRTAPKTRGVDNILCSVLDTDKEIKKLAGIMRQISKRINRPSPARDAACIEGLGYVVLIGVKNNPAGLNCGFCGYGDCKALSSSGGTCSYNSIDLGIALGSAVSVAGGLHIDNRVMYSIGRAAIEAGLFPKEVRQALGIPLSASGKNPFFDRNG